MNRFQLLQQIRYLVRQTTWVDSPNNNIFASHSVVLTNSPIRESLLYKLRWPACIITDAGGAGHAEHPRLILARVALTVLVRHHGDEWGTATLVGANRATTTGSSIHRGLTEVYRAVLADLFRVGREAGISLMLYGESDAAPVKIKEDLMLLGKEFTLQSRIFENEGEYPPVDGVAAASSGSGAVITWNAPVKRWDLLSGAVSVIRKLSSAPSSIDDGTVIVAGSTDTSVVDASPGSGTWFYGAWSKFDERSGTRYSTTGSSVSIVIP